MTPGDSSPTGPTPAEVEARIRAEAEEARQAARRRLIWQIENGELPIAERCDINLRPKEVLHVKTVASWFAIRGKKIGPVTEGSLYVTSKRLLWRSGATAGEFRYSSMIAVPDFDNPPGGFLIERTTGGSLYVKTSDDAIVVALLRELLARGAQ